MKIWVNTIVHNEDRFIWFAVMSVIDFVDKILIWDTGSNDKTVEIIKKIKEIKGDKVEFKEVGGVDKDEFSRMRQRMLEETEADWILILDGDEIWWEDSIKKVIKKIKEEGSNLDAIATPFYNLVGDVYHYQEEAAGRYQILGKTGHLTIRAISRQIPGLHVNLPYGSEGYFDKDNRPIQLRENVSFVNAPYFHASHLKRSSLYWVNKKFKYDLGVEFPRDFKLPEVLNYPYPNFVTSPYSSRSFDYILISVLLYPIRFIKRLL